ncbi:MAG: potassium transporter TrkG [Alphaproteobacteria bacterium]
MAFAPVIALLGRLISLFAGAMLAPALCALVYSEFQAAGIFAGSAAVTLFFGGGMIFATQGTEKRLRGGGDFLLIVIVWPIIAVFAAAPLLLVGAVETPTDAFFEAFSGLTTTGATVMSGLDDQLRSVLFWRAWLQWLGGLAAIIMAVSVLPMLSAGGMQMFRSAMPHGDHATIVDRVLRSGLTLSWIYALLTLICAIALWLAGMNGFDAIAYAFSTISSGGFTPHDGVIGDFGNPIIESVIMIFMVVGVINFTLYWALLHGRPSVFHLDDECRLLYLIILFAALLAILVLNQQGELGAFESIRRGLFATLSMISTTGFVNQLVEPWPAMLPILFLALVFIGGSSGSTAGGIKLMRLHMATRQGRRELERLAHPHGVVRIHYNGQTVPESVVQALWSFFILYMFTFAGLSVMLSFFGLDPVHAVPMALVTLTNAGAGLPLVGGSEGAYALLPAAAKWILCFGMLMGRLELVAVVTVLTPMFWRR